MKSPSSRTYIMPTPYGLAFAGVCVFLLSVAFASTNNAVYLLCFVMASLGVQSLVITNKNIEKLEITQVEIADYFADETGWARVGLHNSLLVDAENIRLEFEKHATTEVERLRPGERRQVRVPLPAKKSGRHALAKLKMSSDFPFYFSRSWKTYQSTAVFHVYPARKGVAVFSENAFLLKGSEAETQDEFKGHRDYRDNDSPRAIDWKVSSRLQKTTVKEYDNEGVKKVWLRWQDAPGVSNEDRQCQLSLWIDLADKKDFEYALELPTRVIEFGSGPSHKALCLQALL